MEKGDLLIIDGKPAEFLEWMEDSDGGYMTYRTLGEVAEHWLSMPSFRMRAKAPKRWRD